MKHKLLFLFLLLAMFASCGCKEGRTIEIRGERVFALHVPRILRENTRSGRRVALTFDDAPNGHTQAILAVLSEFQVRATFFLIGTQVLRHPEVARSIVMAGHEIGNHSFSHALTGGCSEEDVQEDIARAEKVILEVTGCLPLYFRPPAGLVTQSVQRACGRLGYSLVLWSVDSGDWKAQSDDAIVAHVLENVRPGAIILFHPLPCTVRVLPRILRALGEKGYEIVPLSVLFER
ncbi:MAG: polysaccharide deacetylase family protein [Candidatus Caldatribacterium sp.]|uniref:polysaccharide deacetylase family protein n=1 Tax=Candidatus Caldatribacterium sp. TaxID=2282143 RepID=UPI0037EE0575|nr:polysaccharide deacetylase family protein [Candidatus Caldatribacterium sp.]MCX7730792.1 polysaccharide deacetylase family protein [Candidatus Caldatribacterium sp.]